MRILGTGSALPHKIVTNQMLSEFLDTSDEWIVTRTGIRQRHIALELQEAVAAGKLKRFCRFDLRTCRRRVVVLKAVVVVFIG